MCRMGSREGISFLNSQLFWATLNGFSIRLRCLLSRKLTFIHGVFISTHPDEIRGDIFETLRDGNVLCQLTH